MRLRLRPEGSGPDAATALGADFTRVEAQRRDEADEFYAELTPPAASADEAAVMRQAFAGMLWNKQFYNYNVARWLDGDASQPPPPTQRRNVRNARWRSFEAFDVMSMPDTWEYPWFAAWDLAFHCIALVHVDPAFAKYQLSLLCREWFQNPNGALPAYEWDFNDVNPPVQAWAALEVFAIDGGRDFDFLSRIFDKLLVNFTWWVNREDANGSNLFEGGFMGLDNIGPIDRSHLPVHGLLEQSDATGWMAGYALSMATIAAILHGSGHRPALDLVQKFLEHFAGISEALEAVGLWDDEDGFFYDRILLPDGSAVPVRVRSMVAMIPLLAAAVVNEEAIDRTLVTDKMFADYLRRHGLGGTTEMADAGILRGEPGTATAVGRGDRTGQGPAALPNPARSCGVPVAARAPFPVRLPSRPSVRLGRGGCARGHRLRACGVDHRDVRRQLELAGPGVVSAELSRCDGVGALPRILRRRADGRIPDWIGKQGHARRRRRRFLGSPGVDLSRRRERTTALLRRRRADADRSAVARQPAFS